MTSSSSAFLHRPELTKIIVDSLSHTIESYTQTKVSAGKPVLKKASQESDLAVIGLVRLESDTLTLELVLGFSKTVFVALYENMFSMPVEDISPENHDLAGEILNIAFGSMDPQFRKLNMKLHASFPKIYSGALVQEVMGKIGGQGIAIPYLTADKKPFVIELYAGDSIQTNWQYDPGVKGGR
jgi:CheY-specific phosphatase CheX